jgi:hypothetical protein
MMGIIIYFFLHFSNSGFTLQTSIGNLKVRPLANAKLEKMPKIAKNAENLNTLFTSPSLGRLIILRYV